MTMLLNDGDHADFPCINDSYKRKFHSGVYKIECWGANGGDSGDFIGGRGAYSSGVIYFIRDIYLYIYPGSKGYIDNQPSFNGGGQGSSHNGKMMPSGGGASDVRLRYNDLKSRIIVAGGGGAAVFMESFYGANGGDAGGLNGYPGTVSGIGSGDCNSPTAGTQTEGGNGAGFGVGGSNVYSGGGHSSTAENCISSASGGSSFISGHEKCKWIERKTEFTDNGLYFTQTTLFDGKTTFQSPSGNQEKGHTGDGFVRITLIERRSPIHPTWQQKRTINHFTYIFIIFTK